MFCWRWSMSETPISWSAWQIHKLNVAGSLPTSSTIHDKLLPSFVGGVLILLKKSKDSEQRRQYDKINESVLCGGIWLSDCFQTLCCQLCCLPISAQWRCYNVCIVACGVLPLLSLLNMICRVLLEKPKEPFSRGEQVIAQKEIQASPCTSRSGILWFSYPWNQEECTLHPPITEPSFLVSSIGSTGVSCFNKEIFLLCWKMQRACIPRKQIMSVVCVCEDCYST